MHKQNIGLVRYACCKTVIYYKQGRDSAAGIATRYALDCTGIKSRCGAGFSAPVQSGPGAYPASCTVGTGSFPGKSGWGVALTTHSI